MAEVFYFHVQEDRSIKYKLLEPIMQEDKDVATWRFRIPKVLNNIDMSAWSWWFVYVNAKGQTFSELLTLTDDIDEPASYSTADYDIDYGISKFPGIFSFALEAISTEQGGEISGEWHTKTYKHKVDGTLQGNQAEYAETEHDIISALITEYQNLHVGTNQITDGAVTFAKLANDAVTSVKIADGAVTNGKLASNSVSTANVQDGAITEAKIADEAVTNDKLSPDIQKPWYLLKDINMFGQITTVQFPVKKSYVEDITYDTRRNRFYLGVCDYSGGDYNAEIVVVDGDTFSVIHTYYYTFGTIGTLSYNPKTDQIYVALTGGNYRLYSIDAETMESQGELTTETFSVGVQYDIEQEINVALQLSGTTAEIRTYDDDFDLLNTYIIAIEATDTPQQGFAVKNGIVYVPTWNSILEIDYKNNRLNRIGIAKVQRGNDEAEGLCFKNGTLYSASFISGSEGSCAIYKYGFSSGLNFVTARFYNVNSFNTSAVIESYATLFEYIVNGMKANDIAFIYRYGASFSDLPNLYDGNAYITEIYVVKTSPSIEYTQIELCMHQIDETRTNIKRWRGIIKKSSSTAITWIPYGMNPYGKGVTILGGSDLDDYVIPGVYAIEASSTAQNITHMPVAAAGRLEVRESIQDGTGLYIIQTFYRTNSVDAEIYHRVKTTDSTGFGTWKKVAYAT